MRPIPAHALRRNLVLLLAACAAAFGCATSTPGSRALPVGDQPVADRATPATTPTQTVHAEPPRPEVVVVLNGSTSDHLELLQVFAVELGRPYEVLNLADRTPASVRRHLQASAPVRAVTLGSAALAAARDIDGVELVYSGVLDPGGTGRGVDALPAFDAQLEYWLGVAPGIERIGVVGSAAMSDRMEALAAACAERGIALERRQVTSDGEMLLAFRGMVPHIDGFVFLPDNSVLSPPVIQQMMLHGRRNDIQILVYSPLMLELGGTLLVQPDPIAVARSLIRLLDDPARWLAVGSLRAQTGDATMVVAKGTPAPMETGDG